MNSLNEIRAKLELLKEIKDKFKELEETVHQFAYRLRQIETELEVAEERELDELYESEVENQR